MASSPTTTQDFAQAAHRLAGEAIVAIEPAGAGANSRTYRVTTATRTLALKSYPRRAGDQRDRLEVEWQALQFMRAEGLTVVPSPLARDKRNGLMLMEWLEGQPVSRHRPEDLEAAIDFMIQIFLASESPQAALLPLASEACLSAAEIFAQIERRLAAFAPDPLLQEFLTGTFAPRLESLCTALAPEIEDDCQLPRRHRRLIPADFGFHNALRDPSGGLRFVDFDYLGWDDPVKLAADFMLHPAMSLSPPEKRQVIERLAAALPKDEDFLDRLERHRPFYALRWALILLNPFRRDRLLAPSSGDTAFMSLLRGQIEKAERMCKAANLRP